MWTAAGAACAAGIVAPAAAPDALWSALVYDGATLLTALIAFGGARRLAPEARKPWLLIASGLGCFFAGDVIWDLYAHVGSETVPLPSAADVAYLTAYPLIVAGCLDLLGRHTPLGRLNSFLDTTILAAGLSLVVWEPLLLDAGRSVLGALVVGAYPVADIAFVGLAALLVAGTRGSRPLTLLLVGALLLLAADLVYLVLEARGTYATGAWPDALFAVARLAVAGSVWTVASADLQPNPAPLQRGRRPLIATMAVIGSLVALPVDFGLAGEGPLRRNELVVRVGLRIVLLAAVGLRLLRQASENESLVGQLQGTAARLTSVVDATADAVIFATADGTILEWNRAAESLFGRARSEIVGTRALDHVAERDDARAVTEALRSGRGATQMTLPLRLGERVVPVAFQIAAARDDNDNLVGYVAVARDDTAGIFARRARQTFAHLDPEHALMRFAEELTAFVPFDSLSLTSVDRDEYREMARLTRLQSEDSATPVFGVADAAELLEGSVSQLRLVDDGSPYVLMRAAELIERGARFDNTAIKSLIALRLRDPGSAEVRGFLTLGFRDPIGAMAVHADALAAVGPDIARSVDNMLLFEQQRVAADRLRELNDLRDGFLAMVAHDLHSPLSAIGSAASVLHAHRTRMEDELVDDMLRGMATSARQLTRLTGDLVDTTRVGEGRFPCQMDYVADLGAVVAGASAGAAGERRDRLTVTAEDGVAVVGDVDRLTQIVSNLVSNALKFTEANVEVSVCRRGTDAVITVTDHGAGIPPSAAGRVFERYARIAQPGHQPKGSGLGLYITHELVVAHKGRITHCPTRGGGATFEVQLPLGPPEGPGE